MPKFTKEQVKKYVKFLAPLFESRGMVMTDETIDKMVANGMNEEVEIAQELADLDSLQEAARKKYNSKGIEGEPEVEGKSLNYDNFGRIYTTMLRPEKTDEDVAFNRHLEELSHTHKGQREIIKMAADSILKLDLDKIHDNPENVIRYYRDNYSAMRNSFITLSISQALKSINEDPNFPKEEKEEFFKDNYLENFNEKRVAYETGGRMQTLASSMGTPLFALIPNDINYLEVMDKFSHAGNGYDRSLITNEEFFALTQYFIDSVATKENLIGLADDCKKFYAPRFEAANKKVGDFKEKHPGWKFLDDEGKELPDDKAVEWNDHFNLVNDKGDTYAFRVNGKVEMEMTKYPIVGTLDKHVKALKNVKNTFNSKEFKDIIKLVDYVNKDETFRKKSGLEKGQEYAVKLIAIKKKINKYLAHKAQDGVKAKDYGKLAAVEALNKDISERLSMVNIDPFKYKDSNIDVKHLTLTYEQACDKYNKKMQKADENYKDNTPKQLTDKQMDKEMAALNAKFPGAKIDPTVIKNVDDCMCRIMLSSQIQELPADKYVDIVETRKEFREEPEIEAIKKVAQKEAENNVRRM